MERPGTRGQQIKEFLTAHPEVQMEYLPPYHPELNPQERVWHLIRYEVTTSRYHETIDLIEEAIRKSVKSTGGLTRYEHYVKLLSAVTSYKLIWSQLVIIVMPREHYRSRAERMARMKEIFSTGFGKAVRCKVRRPF